RDRLDIEIVEGVAGIEAHAAVVDRLTGDPHLVELRDYRRAFGIAALGVEGVGVRPGVNLAHARTDARRGFDLPQVGVDEHAGYDAGIGQILHRPLEGRFVRGDIEPAFGGDFLAALGYQPGHFRFERAGDAQHFVGGCHFQVELDVDEIAQAAHVVVLDVAAVLAQVHGDAVGAAEMRLHRSPYRIGLVGAACLAQR